MVRRVAYLTALVGLALSLTGCALNLLGGFEQRASWREAEERACLARRDIVATNAITQVREIDGRGPCGIDYPLKVSAFDGGSIAVGPSAMLGCPITEAVEAWLRESVQPAAIAWFGSPVVEIREISNYSCRSRNNVRGARLSEHAFGNALDVAAFKLDNGRVVTRQDRLARLSRRAGLPARDGGDRLPALQDLPRPRRALSRRSFPCRSRPSRQERHVALLQADARR